VQLVRVFRLHTCTRDRRAGRVRVCSECLGGQLVAREALVWSVRSVLAAGGEAPSEGQFAPFGRIGRSACVTERLLWAFGVCGATRGSASHALGE